MPDCEPNDIWGCFDDKIIPKTLQPQQNGQHLTNNIFEKVFLVHKIVILIKISIKFVCTFQHVFNVYVRLILINWMPNLNIHVYMYADQ